MWKDKMHLVEESFLLIFMVRVRGLPDVTKYGVWSSSSVADQFECGVLLTVCFLFSVS